MWKAKIDPGALTLLYWLELDQFAHLNGTARDHLFGGFVAQMPASGA